MNAAILAPEEALEKVCEECCGKAVGRDHEQDCVVDCPACNGSGLTPTQLGARILELVRHNSRKTVSAELHFSSGMLEC